MSVFSPVLLRPAVYFRQRFRSWFENRLPLSDHITLTQRTVYILPTRPGLMLAVTLLILLVASINYQLNLGYLLTFFLAGSALISMHVCHGTLRGLAMHLQAPGVHYAGISTPLDIQLTNNRRATRYGIGLSVMDSHASNHWVWTDVPGQGKSTVQVAFKPTRRGLHRLPTLTAETRFPLGTFRVWTVWRPASQVLVYPAPESAAPPLPPSEPRSGGAANALRAQNTGEFDGVRAYQRGDPLKLIVWKKAAKEDGSNHGLVVRHTAQASAHELWLDFTQTGTADKEHKVSRLCAWVLAADKQAVVYGLRLPSISIAPASGQAHQRQCLEALALC